MNMATDTLSPLERAARALPQMLGPHAFDDLPLDRTEQRKLNREGHSFEHTQADMLDLARAVLQAIRTPSEAMKFAGAALSYQGEAFAPIECIEDAWAAMIDIALADQDEYITIPRLD